MEYDQLKLENQLCFPIYALSRLIIREYKPLLDDLNLTYPQYLVLLLLWETDGLAVNDIAEKLVLNTNTVTPLLKRMETQGLVIRHRSDEDERRVIVTLTPQGLALRDKAATVPERLVSSLASKTMSVDDLKHMVGQIYSLIDHLSDEPHSED